MPSAFAQLEMINPKSVGIDYLVGQSTENKKMGMIHRNQSVFIDFKYDLIETDFYDENKILILHDGETHLVVDELGKKITYNNRGVEWISDKYFIVKKSSLEKTDYAVMDTAGNFIIPLSFEYQLLQKVPEKNLLIAQYSDTLLSTEKNNIKGNYGVIDFNHKIFIPFEYQYIEYLPEEKMFIIQNNKNLYGALNSKGKPLVVIDYRNKEDVIYAFEQAYKNNQPKSEESFPQEDHSQNFANGKKSKKSIPIFSIIIVLIVCFLIWFIPYKINKMREQAWLESE